MILALTGLKGSGKDAFAQHLLDLVPNAVRIAFADPMKDFVAQVYGWPREMLDDLTFKETPDPRYVRLDAATCTNRNFPLFQRFNGDPVPGWRAAGLTPHEWRDYCANGVVHLTPRHALQQLGTQWGRKCYDHTWIHLGLRRAGAALDTGAPLVVITDCRFINEAQAVRDVGGRVLRIVRPGVENLDIHMSEQEQHAIRACWEVVNDGTLEDLKTKAEHFILDLQAAGFIIPLAQATGSDSEKAATHRVGAPRPTEIEPPRYHLGCRWCGSKERHAHEVTQEPPCRACELEAELGTENVPHPIDPRVHTCSVAQDPDAPAAMTVDELVRESHQTAVDKGWHEEDHLPPSTAVRAIAIEGLRIADICRGVERIRKGDYGVAAALDPMPRLLDGLDDKQVRALCWLTLICTEAAEAMEDVVTNRWEISVREDGKVLGLPSEIADIVVRCGDDAGAWGMDLEAALRAKMTWNKTRPHRHGGKKA